MLICTFLPLFSFFGCCIFAGVNGSSPLTTYGRVRPRNTQPSSHNQIMKTQQQPHTGRYAHGNTPPLHAPGRGSSNGMPCSCFPLGCGDGIAENKASSLVFYPEPQPILWKANHIIRQGERRTKQARLFFYPEPQPVLWKANQIIRQGERRTKQARLFFIPSRSLSYGKIRTFAVGYGHSATKGKELK